MRAGTKISLAVVLSALLGACALLPVRPLNVMGTVSYREHGDLPTNASVEVTLYDVSRGAAAAEIVATQSIALDGRRVPVAFDLVVQPGWRKTKGSFVVRAQILTPSGRVLYASDKDYPVTLDKAPAELQVVLKPVKKGAR